MAREAGVDVSRPCIVPDRRFDPLPGMKPGDFRGGGAPHMGAVQAGESAEPVLRRMELRTKGLGSINS